MSTDFNLHEKGDRYHLPERPEPYGAPVVPFAFSPPGLWSAPVRMRFDSVEEPVVASPWEPLLRGHSPEVRDQVLRATRTKSSVLLVGEAGLGKGLLARAIHEHSARRDCPMLVVDLAASFGTSPEVELFGADGETFTPNADRLGRLEAAHGGTLFLDHIGELSATAQAKLLRLLEKSIVTRWDSNEDRCIDVRLIAATPFPLESRVAERSFREDLYSRLSVLVIRLSPLRERPEDILPVVTYWLRHGSPSAETSPRSIDVELLRWLEGYAWPGNLWQLNRCMERMVSGARGTTLTLADLPEDLIEATYAVAPSSRTGKETLSELERTVALRTLQQCGGNRTRAADILGISVRTLQRRLKEWDYHDEVTRP